MKVRIQGWRCNSEVECSPNMHEAMGSVLITTKMCRNNWRVGSVVRVQILSTYKQWRVLSPPVPTMMGVVPLTLATPVLLGFRVRMP